MPIIKIFMQQDNKKLNLKTASEEISSEMGIEPARLNLFVENYPSENCYRASGNNNPIINISAREHNGQQWIQKLMSASAKAVSSQLNVSEDSIIVYAHQIEDGFLLMNGKFS